MTQVFLCDGIRTPIGRYGGVLASVRTDDLAAAPIRELMARNPGVDWAQLDDVLYGCANQAGEDNRNVARMAALLAGLPADVPGATINRLCGSSLDALIQGARAIWSGDADLIIAGGVESMSRAPFSLPKNRSGAYGNITAYDTALGWRYPNAAMERLFPLESMGETAENIAERYHIPRDEQDQFAFQSHRKAVAAQESGRFGDEIVPVPIAGRNAEDNSVRLDEGPRRDTSLEKLAQLPPVFRKNGTVTAGNSSSLNDGAAALLLASEEQAKSLGRQPLARIVSTGVVGVDPRFMGLGPVPATHAALRKAGLTINDMDLIELNEAFASQAIAVVRDLHIPPENLNPNGGAIALGHPLGCSGARIMTTLLFEMRRRRTRYGLATMCVGVGQGVAVVVERM